MVRFPYEMFITGAVISPERHRMAWLAAYERGETWVDRLPTWLRASPTEPKIRLGIWVSGVDGSNLKEVGHIGTLELSTNVNWNRYISNLKWTGDGRALTYWRHNSDWLLDVK